MPSARVSATARVIVTTAATAAMRTRSHDRKAASMMNASARMKAVWNAMQTISRSTTAPP